MKLFVSIFLANLFISAYAQSPNALPLQKIIVSCLDADVKTARELVRQSVPASPSEKEIAFLNEFNARFAGPTDTSSFLKKHSSPIDKVMRIYHTYWRAALLDPATNYDNDLRKNLSTALSQEFKLARATKQLSDYKLDTYLRKFIAMNNLHSTGFGKTGKLFDLLVWTSEKDTTYHFTTRNGVISSKVVFMNDFVTLGWEEYATLNRLYPGGWANRKALYCVRKAYDIKKENFLISYLCHEAQHFADYQVFPKLGSADMEYRAKLAELSMLQETLFDVISFFIINANYDSKNSHSIANYCVIRDLSQALFKTDFERNIDKWKEAGLSKIQDGSYELLKMNSKQLKKKGKNVKWLIKKG